MKKIFNFAYVMNFMSQVIFSFATPLVIWLIIGYLLTAKAGVGDWAMAVSIVLGVLGGVVAMFKYIITASQYFSKNENNENTDKKERKVGNGEKESRDN